MKKILLIFAVVLVSIISPRAHATCTTPITSGMTGSQVQTALNSCSAGDTAQFPAGSYAIGTTLITIPCGVGMSGPVHAWSSTPGYQTATLNGSASNGGYAGFQTTAGSCGSSVIQYLEWNGQHPSNAGNFLNIRPNTQNLTVQYVWGHGNNSPGPGYNQGPTDIVTISGGGASTPVNNITIQWNYFGNTSFSDCATAMNTGDTNENDNGGGCGGVGINGNLTNVTIQNNIFNYEEQPMKTFDGTCVTCNNLVITKNNFQNYERIAYETQASGTAAPSYNVLQYITYNNWGSRYNNPSQSFLTFGISAANGCANAYLTGSNLCEEHVDYNVYVQAVNGANDVGVEMWGMGPSGCTTHCSTASYNWLQGYLYNGITWAWAGNFVFNNNNFNLVNNGTNQNCQSHAGGFWNWDGSDGGSFPIALPSCTGNTFSNAITGTTASATPSISPAGGTYSSAQTVTLTNTGTNRDTNTSIWYTTNGSTPAPGTSTLYTGPITVSSTTTVKYIGMWGAANQPYSYPSGYGYVPSSVQTATYTIGSGPAVTPTFSPGAGTYSSTQTVAISTTSSGAIICWNTTGSPATNGATGCSAGTLYTGPVSVSSSETLYAVAGGTGFTNSTVGSAAYVICSTCVSTPTVAVVGGTVTISTPTPGAGIWYTTDGSTPTLPPGGVPQGTSSSYAPMCQPVTQPPLGNLKNITAYGAVTGGTDNTTAIYNACVAAGPAQSGGPAAQTSGIYIPAGVWYAGNFVYGSTPLNCNIYGQGQSSEIYCPSATVNGNNCQMYSTANNLVWSNFSHQMPFTTRDATNFNLSRNAGSNTMIDSVLVVGGNAGGIQDNGDSSAISTNNGIFNTGADCNYHVGGATNDVTDHEYVYNCGDDSVSNVTYTPGSTDYTTGTLVQWNNLGNNACPACARGISVLGGTNMTFQDNLIQNIKAAGIFIAQENPSAFPEDNVSNILARYNYVTNTNTNGTGYQGGITVESDDPGGVGVTNIGILGNYVVNTSSGSALTFWDGASNISNMSYTNNTLSGTTGAWENTGTGANIQCTGNTYNGVANNSGAICGGTNPSTATGSPVTYSGCVVGTAKQYTGPFSVSGTQTINAVAVFPGLTNSTIGTGSSGPAAASPTFSPVSGTNFTGTQTVTMSDSTAGSTIYYYTSSPPISIITTYGPTFTDSAGNAWGIVNTAGGQMTINGQTVSATNQVVEIVYVNGNVWQLNAPGNWYEVVSVTGTPPTQTVTFGSPTTTSPIPTYSVYTGPLSLTASTSISAYATATGFSNSPVASATYGLQAATPVFSPPSESFSGSLAVSITDSTPGATIYYCTTTTSCTPTTSSTIYTGAITVTATTIINAIAAAPTYVNSAVGNGTYTLIPPPTLTGGFQSNAGNVNTLQVGATAVQQVANGTYSDGLNRTLPDGFGNTAVWSSQNSAILQVTSTGLISCLASSAGATVNSLVQSAPGAVVFNAWGWTCTPGTVAATPTFTPAGETFSGTISVTAASTTPSATLYCTTDGSTPTTSSPVYTGAFSVSTTTTLKCLATASGFTQSAVGSATYTQATVATPTFTPPSESFSGTISVAAASSTSGAVLHCTTNGTTPTISSPTYASPFSVSSTTTIQCLGVATGYLNSAVGSGVYTLSSAALTSCTMTSSPSVTTLTTGGATTQMIGQCFYASTSQTLACSPGADVNGSQIIAWGSSNTSVLNVGLISSGSPGVASGVNAGSANATATATGGKICTPYAFTVAGPTLTGVSVALQSPPGGTVVTIGTPVQACATMTYTGVAATTVCGAGADIYGTTPTAWTSSSHPQATISTSGLVTGVTAGSTNIGVSAGSFTSSPLGITVQAPATNVTLSLGGVVFQGAVVQ